MNTATAQTQTKASASLLAQIKTNIEWDGRSIEDAETICSTLHGCALADITTEQAYVMLREIHRTSKPVEDEPHDGYCMTCERPSSLRQCMDCREGRREGYRPHYQSLV
jgi:hypothetical protein